MTEPTIRCPHCTSEIKLTESLAAPLIQATRQEFEAKLAQKETDVSSREAALKAQQKSLEEAQKTLDEQVASKLKTERALIAAEEAKKSQIGTSLRLGSEVQGIVRIAGNPQGTQQQIGRSTENSG